MRECVLPRSMRLATVKLAAGLIFAACFHAVPAPAQDFDPLLEIRIAEAVQEGRADAALAMIDGALANAADDPRLTEDLLSRKAALAAEIGRHAEALATLQRLREALEARLGPTAPQLVPVLEKLVEAAAAIPDPAEQVEAIAAWLEVLVASGRTAEGEPLLAKLDALVASSPQLAERAAEIADGFRIATEETNRGPFAVDPDQGFTTVRIFYATDRARTGETTPGNFYGGDRGTLELGAADISLPPQHLPGKIERPSVWTLDFREDPGRHVVLQSVTPLDGEEAYRQMRQQLAQNDADSAFVFVHGFNVPFDEAAQRTAQMAYDMNFDGLPILYSWPSRGSVLSYIADTAVVNLSGRRLTLFLEDLVAKSGAKRIHLVAHSMGNRAMTDALELFALRNAGKPPAFDQVLFTAPDIDAGLFSEMMHTIRPVAKRVTLYASDKDWALAVSRRLHGDAARAGQGGNGILHVAEVDSIDMTSIGDDMLAHSYYANNPSALTDILALFWRDAPPSDRCGMTSYEGEHGSYWSYKPEECDSNALLSTLSILRRASIGTLSDARIFMNRFIMPATADPAERTRLEKALARLFRN